MDPVHNLQRNDLKRPRLGSLDDETHRPPPGPPGGAHHAQLQFRPDAHLSAGAQFSPSNSFHPAATAHWIDRLPLGAQNHQQLIPSPSQVLGSNLSMPSTIWPIPSLPTQTYITGGNNIENHGNFNFYHQTSPAHAAHDQCLTQLHNRAASNAIHTSSAVDNQGICMPGTRAFTLQHLQSLVGSTGNDDPDIIWMHGPAGSGKSAIMRTMANALDKDGVLLGSFFFFRSDAQRNTSVPFIPTMASQSFISCPATQPHIRNAVHSQPHIFSQSIRHQLHHLFETPLKLAAGHEPKWTAQSPLVIVIDGLDECADAERQIEIIKAMHQLASTIRSSTNLRVKILIASRPEKPILDEFELYGDSVTIVELDPSDANIDLFYDTRLDEIRRRKGLPESWPSLAQIQWLKGKTSGQYSFAHISMGFLAGGDPVERLKMIENGVGTHGLEPFAALDALYATIFQQIPPEMAENALLLVHFWREYDGCADKKTTHAVECMLSLPSGFSFRLLPYLSSILYIDEGLGGTSSRFLPYHATLDDFLSDRTRAGKYSLFFDRSALLTTVVEGMLGLRTAPLALPLDEETADTWFGYYEYLIKFIPSRFQTKLVCPSTPLGITAICNQLSLLLPTMDLYAFGCCKRFLDIILFYSSLESQHAISRLIDQIHSIQQLRFAVYEALEARGDSGLGLFGLLVLFASGSFEPLHSGIDSEVEECSTSAFRVEAIVAHIVQVCINPDIPESEQNMEESLPLCIRALQLAITKKSPNRPEFKSWHRSHSAGGFALFSARFEGKPFSTLSLCLSQTIMMFLDLPLGRTRIQGKILECIACADHAEVCPQCTPCTLNLQRLQLAVIYSVVDFLCAENLSISERRNAVIDAQTFFRCCRFLNVVREIHQWSNSDYFDDYMMQVGAIILNNELEVEGGTNTPVVDDLRTMVSSHHEKQNVHCEWTVAGLDSFRYEGFGRVPRGDCWVCSGIRRESRASSELDDSDGTDSMG